MTTYDSHKEIDDYIEKNYTFKEKWKNQCEKYDIGELPGVLPAVDRIIVIGDIHGDWEMTQELLKIGKVINDAGEWIGCNTVVVQVGDQIDRCRPTINSQCNTPGATNPDENSDWKILQYFTELHKLASKDGGAVYSLLGNHELMNVNGDFRYVSYKGIEEFNDYVNPYISTFEEDSSITASENKTYSSDNSSITASENSFITASQNKTYSSEKSSITADEYSFITASENKTYSSDNSSITASENSFITEFKNKTYSDNTLKDSMKLRKWAFKPGNPISEFLACTRQMAIIIGSNLFVHAGVLPQIAKKYSVTNLNQLMSLYLWDKLDSPEKYHEIFTSSDISPLWNRVFGKFGINQHSKNSLNIEDAAVICSELLNPLKNIYNVGKIYVGHTPLMDHGISSVCDGKVWLTDFGASKAFDKFAHKTQHNDIRKAQVLEILDDGKIINILK
jgi:hypothetical protein